MTEMVELTALAMRSLNATSKSGVPITSPRLPAPPIGISGFAGTGKTEAANWIEQRWGYQRQHIAEPLRRMLASLLREYDYSDELIARYLTGDLKESVIPEFGKTSREMQISLGTEWMREQVDPDGWADLWGYHALRSEKPVMNDSVRFPNEERPVREAGGFTILIVRPGTAPIAYKWKRLGPVLYRWFRCMWGVHDSERTDRLKPDAVVVNDGSIAALHRQLDTLLASRVST